MAHYAKVNKGVVVEVICAAENFQEQGYHQDKTAGKWIKTSYNTRAGIHYNNGQPSPDQSKALRKNYAGIGYSYDQQRDAFIPPQPYPSWTLNEQTCLWNAPAAMPTDGKRYSWDEANQNWVEVEAVAA